jgi:methyl-accepting chemotaxis protein
LNKSDKVIIDAVSLIDEIARSSQEQATAIVQINQGIEQISSVVQTNAATAEESAAASEELSGQSNMLKELISEFKLRDTENLPYQKQYNGDFYDSSILNNSNAFTGNIVDSKY